MNNWEKINGSIPEQWELELLIPKDKWWEKLVWWYSIGIAIGLIIGMTVIAPMLVMMRGVY